MDNQARENFRLSRTLGRGKNLAVDAYTLNADLNRTMVETMLADLDLALTFAEIASTSEDVTREIETALTPVRLSWRYAMICCPDLLLDESQQREIHRKLRELQYRLKQLGENLAQS